MKKAILLLILSLCSTCRGMQQLRKSLPEAVAASKRAFRRGMKNPFATTATGLAGRQLYTRGLTTTPLYSQPEWPEDLDPRIFSESLVEEEPANETEEIFIQEVAAPEAEGILVPQYLKEQLQGMTTDEQSYLGWLWALLNYLPSKVGFNPFQYSKDTMQSIVADGLEKKRLDAKQQKEEINELKRAIQEELVTATLEGRLSNERRNELSALLSNLGSLAGRLEQHLKDSAHSASHKGTIKDDKLMMLIEESQQAATLNKKLNELLSPDIPDALPASVRSKINAAMERMKLRSLSSDQEHLQSVLSRAQDLRKKVKSGTTTEQLESFDRNIREMEAKIDQFHEYSIELAGQIAALSEFIRAKDAQLSVEKLLSSKQVQQRTQKVLNDAYAQREILIKEQKGTWKKIAFIVAPLPAIIIATYLLGPKALSALTSTDAYQRLVGLITRIPGYQRLPGIKLEWADSGVAQQ